MATKQYVELTDSERAEIAKRLTGVASLGQSQRYRVFLSVGDGTVLNVSTNEFIDAEELEGREFAPVYIERLK